MEAKIQIGEHVLTPAQSMAVRVAVTGFHMQLGEEEIRQGLGVELADGYRARLREVLDVILSEIEK